MAGKVNSIQECRRRTSFFFSIHLIPLGPSPMSEFTYNFANYLRVCPLEGGLLVRTAKNLRKQKLMNVKIKRDVKFDI